MNEDYWPEYYKDREMQEPSPFTRIVSIETELPYVANILDLGAGDGRDSAYLRGFGNVTAVEPNNKIDLEGVTWVKTIPEEDFDLVYARWFFHAIDEEEEEQVLDFIAKHGEVLAAEFRVVGDIPDGTHERRLIDPYVFLSELIDRDFIIRYFDIDYGFSKKGDDDPYLARVIAEHKGR